MGGFFTDPQGRVRPISGKKGAGALATVAAAGVLIASGANLGGAGSVGGAADSPPGRVLQQRTLNGKAEAQKGRTGQALQKMGVKQLKKYAKRELKCGLASYGQVQQFFVRTPCRSLTRTLLLVGDGKGSTIMLSVSWVRMSSSKSAAKLKDLADTDGTGNVTPLASSILQVNGVHFDGMHYGSRRDRTLVVIAEAARASGRPDGELMTGLAEVAAELPAP